MPRGVPTKAKADERLPFHLSTTAATVTMGRHHGGRDGARLIRLPAHLAAHMGDPDEVMLVPAVDGTVVVEGVPLKTPAATPRQP